MVGQSTASTESSVYDDDNASGRGVIRIASVAALGGFLFGYDSAVINGAVSAVSREFNAEAASLGFAVASALLGAATGALLSGRIADHIGRLAVMKIAAVLFLVSAIGTGFARSLSVLVLFRIVGGLGVGMASVIAPAYIAEISPARIRGRLASLQQLAIVTGIFISLLVDFIFATVAGGSSEPFWFGLPGLALDVPRHGRTGRDLRSALVHDSRVPALPHLQAPDPRRHGGADPTAR